MMICLTQATNSKLYRHGFTLVEMLVSVSLFSIVALITTGSILALIGNNSQNQADQQVMGALTMALDSMTREIRNGTYYYCTDNSSNAGNNGFATTTRNCENGLGRGLSFREATPRLTQNVNDDRIAYYRIEDNGRGEIVRKLGVSGAVEPITPAHIDVTELVFYVSDTFPLINSSNNNAEQPVVTIIINAKGVDQPNEPENITTIQTTITQRILDL